MTPTGLHADADNSVVLFDLMHTANEADLKPTRTYPINHNALQEWQAAVATENNALLDDMTALVATNLQHVSFQQFYDQMQRCALEVVDICRRESRELMLFVDKNQSKSNFWWALLVWPVLRSLTTRIIREYLPQQWHESVTADTLIAYIDDAAFSGAQAQSAVSFNNLDMAMFRNAKIQMCYLMGYIGQEASWRLLRGMNGTARLLDSSLRLESVDSALRKKHGNERTTDIWIAVRTNQAFKHCFHNGSAAMLYFDHKLPDQASVLNKLIALGPSYNPQTQLYTFRSFIAGCTPESYSINGDRDALRMLGANHYGDFDAYGGVCPPPFYKSLRYLPFPPVEDSDDDDDEKEDAV